MIGDRWAGLILRDAFLGYRRFEDLRRRSGAARGTLASRLKSLVENDILYKKAYQKAPVRYEYRLTKKGLDLYAFILAVWDWETRWGGENHIPPDLTHTLCRNTMRPEFRCRTCHSPIHAREVNMRIRANLGEAQMSPSRFQRRSSTRQTSEDGVDRRFFHVLDIIGDRWTGLVLAALFFGLKRYDEITAALGIATNILADRLKLLMSANVLVRVPYQETPLRHEYRLTEKGFDLYNHVLQMHEWALRWLVGEQAPPLSLQHAACNMPLHSELVCGECKQELKVTEVRFDPPDN